MNYEQLAHACRTVLGYENVDIILTAAEKKATSPEAAILDAILIEDDVHPVEEALAALPAAEAEFVRRVYGLGGTAPLSLEQAAEACSDDDLRREPLARLVANLAELRTLLVNR